MGCPVEPVPALRLLLTTDSEERGAASPAAAAVLGAAEASLPEGALRGLRAKKN